MSELIPSGTKVWVQGTVTSHKKGADLPYTVHIPGRSGLFFSDAELIPIPPPLSAPDGEGMWVQQRSGFGTSWARNVIKRGGSFGFYVEGDKWTTDCSDSTWHRIPDIFGAGEEVETAATNDDYEVVREFVAGCSAAFSQACDKLIEHLSTPAPPAGTRQET